MRPVLHRLDETVRLENIGLCNAFVTQYFLLLFASRDSEDADAMRCCAMFCFHCLIFECDIVDIGLDLSATSTPLLGRFGS